MKQRGHDIMDHILQRMTTDTSVDAPADSIKYVQNLFRTRTIESRPTVLERVFAVLSLDLAPNRAFFGERSASTAQLRQMLFESGENAIDIRVSNVGTGFDLRGQVLGDGFEAGEVGLANEQFSAKSMMDDAGGFSFTGVSCGEYTLTIRGTRTEIFIEKLILV